MALISRPKEYFVVQKPLAVQQQIENKEPYIETLFNIKLNKKESIEDIIFKHTYVINPRQLRKIVLEFKTETGVWYKEDINKNKVYNVLLKIPRNYTEKIMKLEAEINKNKFSLYQHFEDKDLLLLEVPIEKRRENQILSRKYYVKRINGLMLDFFRDDEGIEDYVGCISNEQNDRCLYVVSEKRLIPFILHYIPHNIKENKVIDFNQEYVLPISIKS